MVKASQFPVKILNDLVLQVVESVPAENETGARKSVSVSPIHGSAASQKAA
jgi:hypothetical protein